MKTCVIVGQNYPDQNLEKIVNEYPRVIIFEPLPDAAKSCREACSVIPGVVVIEAACGEAFCNSSFRVYNTQGLSSSLGEMSADAVQVYGEHNDLSLRGTISVQVLHLGFMLQMLGVDVIDFLLIDAQGMDFTILKTVEPWVAESQVKLIQLEADGNGFRHYNGLPDNSEESILTWMRRFPQYAASRLEDRLAEQPDLVFELTGVS
jgi:FkbM family methyltransferase